MCDKKNNKKTKKIIIVILATIVTVTLIPLLINIIYKIYLPFECFHGELSSGDLLQYVGAALSFIGTIILGLLTIKYNNDVNESNEELIKQSHKPIISCYLICNACFNRSEKNEYQLRFSNLTNNIVLGFRISKVGKKLADGKYCFIEEKYKNINSTIPANSYIEEKINIKENILNDESLVLEISYYNNYNDSFIEVIDLGH